LSLITSTNMNKATYNVLGVMSGTSLDGIDVAYICFTKKENWTFSIEFAETIPYSSEWKENLNSLHSLSKDAMEIENRRYTGLLGKTILHFIQTHKITQLDAVCSHGHTILHQPDKGITYQIGNLADLATQLNQQVVCDFRSQDVFLGGQGAPLVPIGDKLLFSDYDACLNLGGFANGSYVQNGEMIAYDLCAVNTVLNFLAEKKGMPFDRDGHLAQEGKLIPEFYKRLNALGYYKKSNPKSLGIEWVHATIFPLLETYKQFSVEDLMYTYTLHISEEIGKNFKEDQSVLVTGGGAKNSYLISLLKKHTKARIHIPDQKLIDFKEALIFGFLGVLRLRNEENCLASVTGSSMDHSAGVIFYPSNDR